MCHTPLLPPSSLLYPESYPCQAPVFLGALTLYLSSIPLNVNRSTLYLKVLCLSLFVCRGRRYALQEWQAFYSSTIIIIIHLCPIRMHWLILGSKHS